MNNLNKLSALVEGHSNEIRTEITKKTYDSQLLEREQDNNTIQILVSGKVGSLSLLVHVHVFGAKDFPINTDYKKTQSSSRIV